MSSRFGLSAYYILEIAIFLWVRSRIQEDSFDALRDAVFKLWPQLPIEEKNRFLRRLRVYYDVHRFRCPPMNDADVRRAESSGRVRFAAATLLAVHPSAPGGGIRVEMKDTRSGAPAVRHFDWVVNCTGLDPGTAWRSNPLLNALADRGWLRLDPTGIGMHVGSHCEALDAAGNPQPTLRAIGPPTAECSATRSGCRSSPVKSGGSCRTCCAPWIAEFRAA